MREYSYKIQKELVEIYMKKFWPKWRREIFSALYRTFHPTTYSESFSTPTDNFIDMLDVLEDSVNEGVKLGLLNPDTFYSFPRLNRKLIIDEGANLDWVHGMLLFSVIYDLVIDFRCYCGEMNIDPNCEGKCMDDFYCLKPVYEILYEFILELEEFGVPIGDLIGKEKLKKIKLVDILEDEKCSNHKHNWHRKDRETQVCSGRGGCGLERTNTLEPGILWRGTDGIDTDGINDEEPTNNNQGLEDGDMIQEALEDDPEVKYLLDNIDLVKVMKGPDASLISDYVEGLRQWGRYNTIMTDLSPFLTDPETVLKGELSSEIMQWATENESWPPDYEEFFNQQEDPLPYLWAMRQKIRDAMTRITMKSMEQNDEPMEMDNVNKIFKELARRIYSFVLLGPHLKMAQGRKRRLNEADEINPPVVVGDVIQLLHLEDPYSPIPVATKGIVVGFDEDPWENRLLVRWIIDPDKPEFKNMPLYPSIDAYRLVRSEELLEEAIILNEQETQEIKYGKVNKWEMTKPPYKKFVYFNDVEDMPVPGVEKIILVGPTSNYTTISLDATEVQPQKNGTIRVNYNNNTRGDIDLLLNRLERNQPEPEVIDVADENGGGSCKLYNIGNDGWKYWPDTKGDSNKRKLQYTIREILIDVHRQYIAPLGEPTEQHIQNGFINVPGTDAPGTTYGWSILNFFETNPVVRDILLKNYEKHLNEINYPCVGYGWFDINHFNNWLKDNRREIFGINSPIFKELVKANQGTWGRGRNNEIYASKELNRLYPQWEQEGEVGNEPGLSADALTGEDVVIKNKSTGERMAIQIKSLYNSNDVVKRKDGKYWVKSGWLKRYGPNVTHFLFGPTKAGDKGKIFIFKNEGNRPINQEVGGKTNYYMAFNSPPLNPETINESVYRSFWN